MCVRPIPAPCPGHCHPDPLRAPAWPRTPPRGPSPPPPVPPSSAVCSGFFHSGCQEPLMRNKRARPILLLPAHAPPRGAAAVCHGHRGAAGCHHPWALWCCRVPPPGHLCPAHVLLSLGISIPPRRQTEGGVPSSPGCSSAACPRGRGRAGRRGDAGGARSPELSPPVPRPPRGLQPSPRCSVGPRLAPSYLQLRSHFPLSCVCAQKAAGGGEGAQERGRDPPVLARGGGGRVGGRSISRGGDGNGVLAQGGEGALSRDGSSEMGALQGMETGVVPRDRHTAWGQEWYPGTGTLPGDRSGARGQEWCPGREDGWVWDRWWERYPAMERHPELAQASCEPNPLFPFATTPRLPGWRWLPSPMVGAPHKAPPPSSGSAGPRGGKRSVAGAAGPGRFLE